MTYTVPRAFYEKLAENMNDRETADKFASSIEDAIHEISRMAEKETSEKMSLIKMEIKEDLTRTLVTRELFEEKFTSQNIHIDQRFQSMQEQMDYKFQTFQDQMDHRFQSMKEHFDLKFNILIGIMIFGFTVFNPAWIDLIKMFFR